MVEKAFELQIFQNALSAMYMYPIRLYKNDCYNAFEVLLFSDEVVCKKLCTLVGCQEKKQLIPALQKALKSNPRKYYQPIFDLLDQYSEVLLDLMWETKTSNSLVFTREIKSNRTLWLHLMLYDLLPKAYIDEYFQTPYLRKCLIDMNTVCIKLNEDYTVVVGRLFDQDQNTSKIISTIVDGYEIHSSDIFELTKLANIRNFFHLEDVQKDAQQIREVYVLFWDLLDDLPPEISKEALEKITVFIYTIVRKGLAEAKLTLERHLLHFHNGHFRFSIKNGEEEIPQFFKRYFKRYIQNRSFFQSEYTSRLKSTLAKKYTGYEKDDEFYPIHEVIKRISSALYADGACYIKYHLSKQTFRRAAVNDNVEYARGIDAFISKINQRDHQSVKKSRVVKIVKSYFDEKNHNDISKLVLFNLKEEELLQPIPGKTIRSNIAIPVTFKHKLLGILLIDSYRPNAFRQSDIHLVLSISNALSIQIYDEIVEKNLFAIIQNVPNQTQLDDEKSIDQISHNLTKYINSIFFSIGVDIWSYQDGTFRRISSTIRNGAFQEMIIHKNDPEFICKLLEQEEDPLVEEDLQHSRYFVRCKPHVADSRINSVKIYAIRNEGKLVGALSIYNRNLDDYLCIDSRSLESVKNHLQIFFSVIQTFKQQKKLVHNHALHDISQDILMIDEKTRQLKELLFYNFKDIDRYTRYRFGIKLKDINRFTGNLKSSFDFISGKGRAFASKNKIDLLIEEQYGHRQKLFHGETKLLDIIYSIVNSVQYKHKGLWFKIQIEDISLKIIPGILEDLFSNLIQNAVKYSRQGTYISIRSVTLKHSVQIRIENIGIGINEDEVDDIFEYEYRSFNALEYEEEIEEEKVSYPRGERENAGYGLYKCKELMKLISGGIRLEDSVKVGSGYKNIFLLTIPTTFMNQKKVMKEMEERLTEKFKG
jgi:putative methionine-R-sulfoxide reductase with GAF domain